MKTLLDRYLQHRFAWLFFSLLITIAANPMLESLLRFNPLEILLGVNLVAAIASAARMRWVRVLVWLSAAWVAARGLGALSGFAPLQPVSQVAWLVATILATAATARHAVRASTVDSEQLFAALDAYLLVGVIFGVGYSLLDQISPGSFGAPLEHDLDLSRGFYFSFVTLATLGYGDIVPVSETARGIAIVEAIAGQMYLAVLVARLVSLYSQKEKA
jgi:Ion channel